MNTLNFTVNSEKKIIIILLTKEHDLIDIFIILNALQNAKYDIKKILLIKQSIQSIKKINDITSFYNKKTYLELDYFITEKTKIKHENSWIIEQNDDSHTTTINIYYNNNIKHHILNIKTREEVINEIIENFKKKHKY